jgi:ankyrin repeat protein
MHACQHGQLQMVKFLLDSGAEMDATDVRVQTRLLCAGHQLALVSLLACLLFFIW